MTLLSAIHLSGSYSSINDKSQLKHLSSFTHPNSHYIFKTVSQENFQDLQGTPAKE